MRIRIYAGQLNRKIELLRPSAEIDGAGSHIKTFTSAGYRWANIRQITLREQLRMQVELEQDTYTVLMRYLAGVKPGWCKPGWCLSWGGNRYRVISAEADKATGYMILGAELDNSIIQEATT